jgi:hypothetical protein
MSVVRVIKKKLLYNREHEFFEHFRITWSRAVLSRAINFGRQCHFKIWLDCHKFKKIPCLIMPMSTKCQKNENKMTINVIQHDVRL